MTFPKLRANASLPPGTVVLVTPGEYIDVRLPDDPPELEFVEESRDAEKITGTLVWRRRLVEVKPPSGVVMTNVGKPEEQKP
jgi:hypothetical protein